LLNASDKNGTMSIKIAFIGTGQIAGWHLRGLKDLSAAVPGAEPLFHLTAVADPRQEVRERFAAEAETQLGTCPTLYANYHEMLEKESLDAAALLVPHHLHWMIARDCLDAGLHLQVQKPIAITIAEGRRIIEYAALKKRALVVSEPSVLGRRTRAVITALRSGELIGTPTMLLDYAVTTLNGGFFMNTPWRHLKGMAGAGWFLDHGVHRTHWFLEALGSVESVFGAANTFEPTRSDEKHGAFSVDTEDCAMTTIRFSEGTLGHFLVASAGQGTGFGAVRVYGTTGVADLSGGTVQRNGEAARPLTDAVAEFTDAAIPEDAMAHSFLELANLITDDKIPISSGERALEALAVIYACLEAATIARPVSIADVLSGAAHAYEDSIEAARPALTEMAAERVS
jgi:UDP-N-acetyl-2-amino-2-deoxyglucuronate dehydrogenase